MGDGSGMNWTPWDQGLATNGETWGMFGTDFGDVNNDGLLDVVSISFGCCAGFHVYINQGNGSWVPSFGILGNNSDMLVQFADLNNDGNLDFVAGHALGTAYFGNGLGLFFKNDAGLPSYGWNVPRYGIAVGDINNDGSYGISFITPSGGVMVYEFNNATGQWINYSGNLPSSGQYQLSQLWDMDADGYLDLMAFGKRNFSLWLGDGTGNWTPSTTFQTNATPGNAKAFRAGGDMNQNGHGDLVILAEEGSLWSYQNKLYVYFENSVADSLWIRTFYPKGNERFYPGAARFIEWASAVPNQTASWVTIELSAYGPDGPWWIIADSIPNNGKYQWIVPNVGSQECYLRLTVSTPTDQASYVSLTSFTVIGAPVKSPFWSEPESWIYPNPGNDYITLFYPQQIQKFEIISLSGKIVLSGPVTGHIINTSSLKPGFYIVGLQSFQGNKHYHKWLKK